MIKTIILYTRRNVGLYALSYLVAKKYQVRVITDDPNVEWLANALGCKTTSLDEMGEFDLFLCVHGNKIINEKYLIKKKFVNIHPCLKKYKGHNPIKRFIENGDVVGSVDSHYMTGVVDEGEHIYSIGFHTGKVNSFAEYYNIAAIYYYKCIDQTLKLVL